jgi:DMSO reductase anchor subunit
MKRKINPLVIAYAVLMFLLTITLTTMLFVVRKDLVWELPNLIVIGMLLVLGYIVSAGLFYFELHKNEEDYV